MSFQYIGSYRDTGNRAIPSYRGNVSSPQQCQQLALQNGDNVYGLQDYGQCFTGRNLQQATEYGPYFGYAPPLGTGWQNQVYYAPPNTMPSYSLSPNELQCYQNNYPDLKGLNPQQLQTHWSTVGQQQQRTTSCPGIQNVSGNYTYQGCFNDSGYRAIPNYVQNVSSVDECGQIAENRQRMIFGVQNGGECFVSDPIPNMTRSQMYGQNYTSQCGSALGGGWTNRVYVRGQSFPPPDPPVPNLNKNNFNNS